MAKVTLELEIGELPVYQDDDTGYIESATIEAAVIQAAAAMLLKQYEGGIQKQMSQKIEQAINGIVRAKLDEIISATIETEYPVLNEWGRPTGQTTTIRQRVEELIPRVMNEKVDDEGRTSDETPFSHRGKHFRWEYHLKKSVAEQLDKQLKSQIDAVVREARDAAAKRVADLLAGVNTK